MCIRDRLCAVLVRAVKEEPVELVAGIGMSAYAAGTGAAGGEGEYYLVSGL